MLLLLLNLFFLTLVSCYQFPYHPYANVLYNYPLSSFKNYPNLMQTPNYSYGNVQPRQNMFGLSGINSALSPITSLLNRMPSYLIPNPDALLPTRSFEPCDDDKGQSGTCMNSATCSNNGGKASDSCGGMFGNTCCINTVSRCGTRITLNNTYWTQPTSISNLSTCGVTIALDSNLIEQNRKICQIRLDFIDFSIAQPNNQTQCSTDNFQIGDTVNKVPIICGDNPYQHMYLQPQSSISEVHLLFTFGIATVSRKWNMKISFLPCGASYLAPTDCLQYFTQSYGTVMSFNWHDVPFSGNRQLANQDYRICFRSERLTDSVSNGICFSACDISSNAKVFGLSNLITTRSSVKDCSNDYLIINSGYDPYSNLNPEENLWDRYCGEYFNVNPNVLDHGKVCTKLKPYSIHYYTNYDEESVNSLGRMDSADTGSGFCLKFQQIAS